MNSSEKYWICKNEKVPKKSRDILNEYLLSLKTENKTEATVDKYRRVLESFLQVITISLNELTPESVRTWLDEFSIGKKPTTVDLILSVLSSFFQFCLDEEYIEIVVMKKRWRPKIPKALPKFLDAFEYARVKQFTEQLPIRDRALILLLFSTGCRVTEVSNLNIEDIDLTKRTANVLGKGKKFRSTFFSEECSLALREHLETRSLNSTEPLFENKFGNRLQDGGIRKVLQKVGWKSGLKQSFHPHCCRHTFATNMLARGAELELIADILGHVNLNTTRIYAQIPTEDMMLKYQNIMG
ncbi:tyrosine-type recombinase/integrase [Sporosarcina sp. FSL K6-1508]|uniref:tyrosine-type recombinase/integrase n=1 Tax=Sporosarcina sp. FSL K6-1508 TaxID=2921553 RepID=UPI0030FA5DCB